jgi:hypothetical protein
VLAVPFRGINDVPLLRMELSDHCDKVSGRLMDDGTVWPPGLLVHRNRSFRDHHERESNHHNELLYDMFCIFHVFSARNGALVDMLQCAVDLDEFRVR